MGYVFYYSNPEHIEYSSFYSIFEYYNKQTEEYTRYLKAIEKKLENVVNPGPDLDPRTEAKKICAKYKIDSVMGFCAYLKGQVEEFNGFFASIDEKDPVFIGIKILVDNSRSLYAFKTESKCYLFSPLEDDVRFVNGKEYPVKQVDLCNIYGDDLK